MRMQNKLKMVLNSILLPQHPENESIFPELMTMVHDLRTLNTLHTEKFLQQCKIDNGPPVSMASNSAAASNTDYEAAVSHQRWDSAHLDRESTGNGSPQSSSGGDTHSSTSLEDTSSRRSPMGSVSSTDSSTTSEVSKLLSTVQDLRMNGNSVLMTALTSQANGGVTISRKNGNGSLTTTQCPMAAGTISTAVTMAVAAGVNANNIVNNLNSKYNHQMRKTESPFGNDSGVETNAGSTSGGSMASGGLHPATSSTNNSSVCSSPRSSSESSESKGSRSSASASPPGNEERHPLLKRALQQPPQMFNNVNTFQDEVYKPHKKFRRHNNSFSKDDCPSSSTQPRSASPEVIAAPQQQQPQPHHPGNATAAAAAQNAVRSLLASQLAEPPQVYHPARPGPSSGSSSTPSGTSGSSLLASTLSQGISLATEESKRNELLAQLILGDGRGPLPPRIGGHPASAPSPAASHQQRQPQGLLMCATGATPTWSSTSATPSYSQQPNRHIPVATLPTKPHTGSSSTNGRMSGATPAAAAAATAPPPSATVTSAEASMMQPLNLSKRIESKNSNATSSGAAGMASSMASSAPNNAEKQTAASNGHDIPTEA